MKINVVLLVFWSIFISITFAKNIHLDNEKFEFKISYVHNLIKNNGWSCKDVVRYFIDRAVKYDPQIRSIISYNPRVFQRAQELDEYYAENKKFIGKLHCVPMLIKDNIDMIGIPTTGGINALRNSVPQKNALVIDRLNKEGAVYLAKANMAQLAIGSTPSDSVGLCQNPFNFNRTCGGSSSGSAAGIVSGFSVVSLGTDTSGSIVGMKNDFF